MNSRWIEGNDFRLLENGEEFFPRVFECIAHAQKEVVLETFILFEDKVGLALHEALVAAAKRGVSVTAWLEEALKDFGDIFRAHPLELAANDFGARDLGERAHPVDKGLFFRSHGGSLLSCLSSSFHRSCCPPLGTADFSRSRLS